MATVSISDERPITEGERSLLNRVFESTLPYRYLRVCANTHNIGGKDNSITPFDIPHFATTIWCADFSAPVPTVSEEDKGIFIHEFVHVWQYYHGITNASALWLLARYRGDYDPLAYRYDLSDSDDFADYNIEQQASIIEDWYRVVNGLRPQKNTGNVRSLFAYNRYVDQMRRGGAPYNPASYSGMDGFPY